MKFLILLALIAMPAFAQQTSLRLPRDSMNTPLIAGLGLPQLCEVAVTLATYDPAAVCQLSFSGVNQQRQYRHIMALNPSTTDSAYICFGSDTGCSTDMMKLRPGYSLTQDFGFFGVGNNITRVWVRMSAPGATTVDVTVW